MEKRKLILDFDGTLTDVGGIFSGYQSDFERFFSEKSGVGRDELREKVLVARKKAFDDPMEGWINNGVVTIPARADPYVLDGIAYRNVALDMGLSLEDANNLIEESFQFAHSENPAPLRDGVKSFLEEAGEKYGVTIVTNSREEHAKSVLAESGVGYVPVVGSARKMEVDPKWCSVPESVQPKGFVRSVMLRRRNYYDVLWNLEALSRDTTVVGDIFEADLALPDHYGMKVVLLDNGLAAEHEVRYLKGKPLGKVVKNLDGIRNAIFR